ncbi:MAG: class I SAM-dependent methyltransferase [Myxococcota bacterium]
MQSFDPAQVRRYYDRHTARFVALGQGGNLGAIHRAVWGPGARDRAAAFRWVEDRLAEHVHRLGEPGPQPDAKPNVKPDAKPESAPWHVLDLGCGIGASLSYLAERLPIRGTGITLSPVQARLAAQRIDQAGLGDRVRCIEGDYCELPDDLGPVDLAYAIESFLHGPDPRRFFAQCARVVRPGGVLVLCDDFRRSTAEPAAARSIDRFVRGWHVGTLLDRQQVRAIAQQAGFEHESTTDLTPYLELGRPRDHAIAVMVALVGWLPPVARRYDDLIGGSALQRCLTRGWVGYDLACFRRV